MGDKDVMVWLLIVMMI